MSPLRHVAVLTLLVWTLWPTLSWAGGWYLLIPPSGNVGDAAIRGWQQLDAYETLAECHADQARARQAYVDWWQREYRAAQRGRTATVDPRNYSSVFRHPSGFAWIVAPLWFPGQDFTDPRSSTKEHHERARRRAWVLLKRGIEYPTFDELIPALDFRDREARAPSPLPAAAPPPPRQAFDRPPDLWSVEDRAGREDLEKQFPELRQWLAPRNLFDFERLLIIFTQGRCLASDDPRLQ